MKPTVIPVKTWHDVGQALSLFSQYAPRDDAEPKGQCEITGTGKNTFTLSLSLKLKSK